MNWLDAPIAAPSESARASAAERQRKLTKPPGALGQLEVIAERFAAWQDRSVPTVDAVAIRVFAGDHGVTHQGVSAFPAEVTAQMVTNFLEGGAAICVLARAIEADFRIVNMGTFATVADAPGLDNLALAAGTADFTETEAMSEELVAACLAAGCSQVDQLRTDLFIAGDMGIGNTTAAAAVIAALWELPAAQTVGRGTGVDDATLATKIAVVERALSRHAARMTDWRSVLRCVGGLEIAAMCGAYVRCAQRGIPVLLDGFIATAAAALACRANPGVAQWMIAGHESAESAHAQALARLDLAPLLSLQMRLGEGSGAAVAVPIIRAALALHAQMSTFEQAGVSAT